MLDAATVRTVSNRTPIASDPLARIVHEALGSILAPSRCEQVLSEALAKAGIAALPEHPGAMRTFLEGALFAVIARFMGVSDAVELVGQVRASMELALSPPPERSPESQIRERLRVPAPPARLLGVTSASIVLFLLADLVGEDVDVVAVTSAPGLVERLRREGDGPFFIVVDRRHPCVEPSVCAHLRKLGGASTVVWWGAALGEQAAVTASLAGGPRLITTETDLRLADLGVMCRQLLERASDSRSPD